MPSPVVHFEIGSPDSAALSEFYASVFNWSFLDAGAVRPVFGGHEGGPSGMLNTLGHAPHTYVMIYIEVADMDEALGRVREAGGSVTVGPAPLPDNRAFAWITDPAGNTLGLLTPLPRPANG